MKLALWIELKALTHKDAAARLGVSRSYLTKLLAGGAPSDTLKLAIEFATDGAVAFADWRDAALCEERVLHEDNLKNRLPPRHPKMAEILGALS